MFFKQRATENATLAYFSGCAGLAKAVPVDVVAGNRDGFMVGAGMVGQLLTLPAELVLAAKLHGTLAEPAHA